MKLAPIADPRVFVTTRDSLHAVAEHVLAALRYRTERRIGLAATPGGFGTPDLGTVGTARVDGIELVVTRDGDERRTPLSTLAAAAAACGIEAQAPEVYTPVTPLVPDAPLAVDATAAATHAAWLAFGWGRLTAIAGDATRPTLWPEHFDAAVELGDEARGQRGTFGVSPGDAEHALPYLYVTHWSDVTPDAYWNDTAFPGASITYDELRTAPDPAERADEFFANARRRLSG